MSEEVRRYCMCVWPQPGPLYWDWRCLRCSGEIVGWFSRWRLRRAARNEQTYEEVR